jgi:hypothetical protein
MKFNNTDIPPYNNFKGQVHSFSIWKSKKSIEYLLDIYNSFIYFKSSIQNTYDNFNEKKNK